MVIRECWSFLEGRLPNVEPTVGIFESLDALLAAASTFQSGNAGRDECRLLGKNSTGVSFCLSIGKKIFTAIRPHQRQQQGPTCLTNHDCAMDMFENLYFPGTDYPTYSIGYSPPDRFFSYFDDAGLLLC